MITTPSIVDTQELRAAVIHLQTPRSEIMHAMRSAIEELRRVISSQNLKVSGPMFAHHLVLSATDFDFETGFPVDGEVTAEGRVLAGELPAGRAVHATYVGGYEGLAAAWAEFARIGRQQPGAGDVRLATGLWESYTVGPESGLDPGKWRTELYQPLLP